MKKKNNKLQLKIYIAIVAIMVICIILLGTKIVNKKVLDSEVSKILSKNIITDKFDTSTKTVGNYKKVEYAIKRYMKDYSTNIKKANDIINDDKLKKVLSASNYESDKPDFSNSLTLINSKKTEFNKVINNLLSMTEEKTIVSYINDEKLPNSYVNLYKDYMFSDSFEADLKQNKESIASLRQSGLNLLETDEKVINLLKANPNSWIIKEGSIYFYSNTVMNEYNNLINTISSK